MEYARKRVELSADNAADGFVGNHALDDPNPVLARKLAVIMVTMWKNGECYVARPAVES